MRAWLWRTKRCETCTYVKHVKQSTIRRGTARTDPRDHSGANPSYKNILLICSTQRHYDGTIMGVVYEIQVKVTHVFSKHCKERPVQLSQCPSTGSTQVSELKITKDRSSFQTPVEIKTFT